MLRIKASHCLAFLLLGMSWLPMAWALDSDGDLPAKFDSDQLSYNQKTGVTVFTGHVTMDQGSTHLTADQVTIHSNKEGKIVQVIATGKQAHYTTLPEGKDKIMDAFADTIEYYPLDKKAILIGNAFVNQSPNQLRGSHIIYDMTKQQVLSLASPTGQKTVVVLQPQDLPGKDQDQEQTPDQN